METNIGSFKIVKYNDSNLEHIRFKIQLVTDPVITKWFKTKIDRDLINNDFTENISANNSYLVKKDNDLVGYVRLENLKFDGIIKLEAAIHKDFRADKIGRNLLIELTNYIIKNIKEVKNIQLDISIYNYPSQKCAVYAGYDCVEREEDNYKFRLK